MQLDSSRLLLPAILAALLAGCGGAPGPVEEAPPSADGSFELTPCQLAPPGSTTRVEAKCGKLTVPENRDDPEGGRIDLRVAVLSAINRDAEPDPLFLLAGGPGQAATEAFPGLLSALRRIRQERDLVMMDQRGTGQLSKLVCPQETEELRSVVDFGAAETRSLLEDCVKQFDSDPSFYTTRAAMADVEDLRQALGYDEINLYGVSYGTRAALTYARLYPQNVRTLLLEGVVPQEHAVGSGMSAEGQRALELVLGRCAEDEACAEAFPDLADKLQTVLGWLEDEPRMVEVDHPLTGEKVELVITRDMAAATIRGMTYLPELVSLLPLMIDQTHESGDFAPFGSQLLNVGLTLGQGMSQTLLFSVLCAEDVPFFDPEQDDSSSYLRGSLRESFRSTCELWPVEAVDPSFKEPVVSDIPTLLLSGDADPVTPPSYAEATASHLSDSLHVVVPGMGHGVLRLGCLPRLAEQFVESGSVADIDPACADEIQPPPFFLSYTGPHP